MPIGDGSNTKWGETGYSVRRINNLFDLGCKRMGYEIGGLSILGLGLVVVKTRYRAIKFGSICVENKTDWDSRFLDGLHSEGL